MRQRSQCKECGGGSICLHERVRSICKDCKGSQICQHKRLRSHCKDCNRSAICQHERVRSKCKECGGSQLCQHERVRSVCKDCNGGAICQHERERSVCKDCKGSQICQHQKRRSICKDCNPKGHLVQVVRTRVAKALRGDKELSSQDYIGCDIATFRAHLESQFKDGMSWDNYGDWNIGHWMPLQYKIDGKTPTLEEVAQRLHYINTQPLWRMKTAHASKSGVR